MKFCDISLLLLSHSSSNPLLSIVIRTKGTQASFTVPLLGKE